MEDEATMVAMHHDNAEDAGGASGRVPPVEGTTNTVMRTEFAGDETMRTPPVSGTSAANAGLTPAGQPPAVGTGGAASDRVVVTAGLPASVTSASSASAGMPSVASGTQPEASQVVDRGPTWLNRADSGGPYDAGDFDKDRSSGKMGPALGIGGGTLLAAGGAAGAAWYYRRWRAERNKPLNRLRRGAKGFATSVGGRLPDVEVGRPGGAGAAALLLALVAARALRGRGTGAGSVPEADLDAPLPEVIAGGRRVSFDALRDALGLAAVTQTDDTEEAPGRWGRLAAAAGSAATLARERSAERLGAVRERAESLDASEDTRAAAGVGIGGVLAVAAVAYLAWRWLTSRDDDLHQGWHDAAIRGETLPNQ